MRAYSAVLITAVVLLAVGCGGAGGVSDKPHLLSTLSQAPGTWLTKAPIPTERSNFGAATVNGLLYAVGGCCVIENTFPVAVPNVESYNSATNSWSEVASMLVPREALAVAGGNGLIYAVGGIGGSDGHNGILNTLEKYDPQTNTWTLEAPMPTSRAFLSAAVVNGILYAMGGIDATECTLTTVEAYDPSTNTWSEKTPMRVPRTFFTANAINGIVYVVGGSSESRELPILSEVDAYDPSTNHWHAVASIPTPRESLASAVVGNVLYTVGGGTVKQLVPA